MTYKRTTTLTVLHVVEEFHDDETPTLSGMRVPTTYDTTAEVVPESLPALVKCGPFATQSRRKVAR